MIYLLRFEDTYGLADVFCKANNIPYVEASYRGTVKISDTLYIETGIGAVDALRISRNGVLKILDVNPDVVITVFDLDSPATHNEYPLSIEEFNKNVHYTEKHLKGPELRWLLIPWCAETILLNYSIPEAIKLVNNQTWRYQTTLLSILKHIDPVVKVKVFRNHLTTDEMVYITNRVDDAHTLITNYQSCGYSASVAASVIEDYYNRFYTYLKDITPFTLDGVNLTNHDSLYANKSRFEYFPKTYK